MVHQGTVDTEKLKKELAKRAIAQATQSRWDEAAATNLHLLKAFPQDLEAYNRLGKALTELGRVRDAKAAFRKALEISPYNGIARKNLDRLLQLGDAAAPGHVKSGSAPRAFIEESGKSGVTSLINLAHSKVLFKMAAGHPVQLTVQGGGLKVTDPDGEHLGQVEPKLASRLVRLMKGGNRYQATVTSVGEQELTVLVRETHQGPSHAGAVSFPSKSGESNPVYLPGTILGIDFGDDETAKLDPSAVKDWTDDDTEPGDDDAYSPVVHRIISTENGGRSEGDEI